MTQNEYPIVSVIKPAYNAERVLARLVNYVQQCAVAQPNRFYTPISS